MRYELRQYGQLIAAVVAATRGNVKAKKFVKYHQNAMGQGRSDWRLLADALDCILAGERDENALCGSLDKTGIQAEIIRTILSGIENPRTVKTLLES